MSITTVSNYLTSATSNNTNNTIVARDASGNFSAGIVTATTFVGNLTGTATTATKVDASVTGIGSAELVRGNMANDDQFRILVGGTAPDYGYAEIATADNGNEPIYVRQYTNDGSNPFGTLNRTLTLLDASGNSSFPGIVTATSIVGNGTIPVGGIIMWSGTIANIPTPGWALCDGSNSTPDLRNKFIVGAYGGAGIGTISTAGPEISIDTATNPNYTPGNIGGETAHKLTIAELASHTHLLTNQISGGGSSVGGGGSGTIDIQSGSAGSSNYHENRPPYYALAFIMRTS